MQTARFLTKSLVAVLFLGASGCYSFGLLRSDLPSAPPDEKTKIVLRVTPMEGYPVLLRNPWVDQRVVGGEVGHQPWTVLLTEVDLIEEKYFDRDRTARFVAYGVAISLGLLGWETSG